MADRYEGGIAFIDDAYRPIEEAKISILDFGFQRSDANQDTISVWDGAFFRLDDHQARFERNNARLRLSCATIGRAAMRSSPSACAAAPCATPMCRW